MRQSEKTRGLPMKKSDHHHDEDGERCRARRGCRGGSGWSRTVARSSASANRFGVECLAISAAPAFASSTSAERIGARSGWAMCSMKAISRSAVPTSALVISSATRPRSSTTKRSAISKTWWMLWPMKRIERPLCAHRAHEAEDLLGLGQRQRGRRLVEDDEVGIVVDGARDGDALPLAARQLADDRIRREDLRGEADLAHQALGLGALLLRRRAARARSVISRPMKMLRTMVCCTASARSWNTVSMPAVARLAGVPAVHRLAAHEDLAARRPHRAGENLDQRRLAGAVVADEADHLAAVDVHVDAAHGKDVAVRLLDFAKLDQPLAHGPCPNEIETARRPWPPRRDVVQTISAGLRSRGRRRCRSSRALTKPAPVSTLIAPRP